MAAKKVKNRRGRVIQKQGKLINKTKTVAAAPPKDQEPEEDEEEDHTAGSDLEEEDF
jgi:hypothetical protein